MPAIHAIVIIIVPEIRWNKNEVSVRVSVVARNLDQEYQCGIKFAFTSAS